jgi:hypothetical protein
MIGQKSKVKSQKSKGEAVANAAFVYKKRIRNDYCSWSFILFEGFFIINIACGGGRFFVFIRSEDRMVGRPGSVFKVRGKHSEVSQ